jgi:hypothetical protein
MGILNLRLLWKVKNRLYVKYLPQYWNCASEGSPPILKLLWELNFENGSTLLEECAVLLFKTCHKTDEIRLIDR